MMLYQRGDATAVTALVESLSPQLYRFFASQMGSRTDAEDMLQDVWLRIHRVRHTYRPSEPLLPWVYAISRRVRVDSYRKRQRIASRETSAYVLSELPAHEEETSNLPPFEGLVALLPESQREVLTMLKVNGLSIEEVARADVFNGRSGQAEGPPGIRAFTLFVGACAPRRRQQNSRTVTCRGVAFGPPLRADRSGKIVGR
jgi:RNA polymerase sigma-70 factor (ECF subfamily)